MRFTFSLALALAIVGPASAQIDEDFAKANRIFGQISAASVVDDIEGEWLPLSTLSNLNGADPDPGLVASYLERICGNDTVRGAVIEGIDQASFTMAAPNTGGELVYRFDWLGGAQFHRSFDPETLFRVRKFDTIEGEKGVEMRARALEASTSLVDLYRVSPDLLAMATPQRVEIFGRCPN
ncbi:hypothetical protein FPY71_01550 [Aureimonas fodinaquatilis]|uniref:Uncharacterized protein n=1 Tax=Aureimonas fodinaquatilis TaxID=2565783 RepID=A0A5B0DZ80_9HYPH|nr:hypothetical protein [Aureimonas fodinaquatilis]KAA0971843.1 hypothetical protein FPY71_01550 [Aureimonas fodinaquatilis]